MRQSAGVPDRSYGLSYMMVDSTSWSSFYDENGQLQAARFKDQQVTINIAFDAITGGGTANITMSYDEGGTENFAGISMLAIPKLLNAEKSSTGISANAVSALAGYGGWIKKITSVTLVLSNQAWPRHLVNDKLASVAFDIP